MKYRAEIDGLRALAVLPVILFHAGFAGFEGGFLGVDIFFVISGYLITSILIKELNEGEFSLLRFYERRARRILPALFAVMLISMVPAFMLMLPAHYEEFSRSLIAVPLFVSNIFFWRASGYFAESIEEKPLVHTWSLAVEEQYYLFFPILLYVLWRFFSPKLCWVVLVLGTAVSLALSEYAAPRYPNANFFLLPMRAWELFVGSLCAMYISKNGLKSSNLISGAGLLAVVGAMVWFDEEMPHPSSITLLPVLGVAVLIVFADAKTLVAKLLSLKLVVGVGLVSYSAYLWHQPLFAYARIANSNGVQPYHFGLLIAVCFALAYLSWRFIEQPFRCRGEKAVVSNKQLIAFSLAGAILFMGIGAMGVATNGREAWWREGLSPAQIKAYELTERSKEVARPRDNGDCRFMVPRLNDALKQRIANCQQRYGKGILLLGDSHMMDLFYSFTHTHSLSDYPSIIALAYSPYASAADAGEFYEDFLEYVKQGQPFSHAIFSLAGFKLVADANGRPVTREKLLYTPLDGSFSDLKPNQPNITEFAQTLQKITQAGVPVTWLGSRLEPQIRRTSLVTLGCDYAFALRDGQEALYTQLDNAIAAQSAEAGLHFVSSMQLMQFDLETDFLTCDASYWSDGDHFSDAGEIRFGQRLRLQKILPHETP